MSIPSEPDTTFMQTEDSDVSLSTFLSRPVRVATYSWPVGGFLNESFSPWGLFYNRDSVKAKLRNFHLLRSKLHVKFMINGNGFYYGRAMASYLPLPLADQFAPIIGDPDPTNLVIESQFPRVFLDPTESQGATMELPFFYRNSACKILTSEIGDLGRIYLRTLNELNHANGLTDGDVTVTVMVWASDVSLSVMTATPQSTEFGDKTISNTAAAVARSAGALSSVPMIGPYAKATSIAAGAIATTAKLYGYSKPLLLSDDPSVVPNHFGNMVSTMSSDSSVKLALDPKSEICVDSRTMGLSGADEMTIQAIASKETYIDTFIWQTNQPVSTFLWNGLSTPGYYQTRSGIPDPKFLSSMMFAALPFRYWRGSIKFRFQIVASSFHKGRLLIQFDPNVQTSDEPDLNTVYSHIADLANERDFTVCCGWTSNKPFLVTPVLSLPPDDYYGNTELTETYDMSTGILKVSVLNELTSPSTTEGQFVFVNVFVSAGDDFEVAVPTSEALRTLSYRVPQTLLPREPHMNAPESDSTTAESIPQDPACLGDLATILSLSDKTQDVFIGDPVVSFRQLLKRYQLHSSWMQPGVTARINNITMNVFPFYRGYCTSTLEALAFDIDNHDYNFAKMTLLNYLTPAFAAWRGSIRYKIAVASPVEKGSLIGAMRDISYPINLIGNSNEIDYVTSSAFAHSISDRMPDTLDGAHMVACTENPVLQVDFPYQTQYRFASARAVDIHGTPEETTGTLASTGINIFSVMKASSLIPPAIIWQVATGEDFTLAFYLAPPPIYEYLDPAPRIT
ncbi:structural protein [Antarctic picorna-like virus 2]|uniref:structural protein n=1 Tax=Antarctic picorna-like virus 2 TaxID=1648482 RepID=UPI00067A5F8B|nr:structural protein [Antarctic picorna-like virus 2]AKG93963.1 structural protein [Antarctic picorna-like virus 2]